MLFEETIRAESIARDEAMRKWQADEKAKESERRRLERVEDRKNKINDRYWAIAIAIIAAIIGGFLRR